MRQASTSSPGRAAVHGRDRRQDLINAGIQLISQASGAVRVSDVTKQAATAKGTFYLYFETWGEFLAAIRDHLLTGYLADMEERVGTVRKRNYWQTLRSEIEHFIDWIAKRKALHRAVFHGAELTRGISADLAADTLIIRLLNLGKTLDQVSGSVDVAIAAPLIFQMLHTAGELVTEGSREKVVKQTYRLIRAGLEA